MKLIKFLVVIFFVVLCFSCSTKKNIIYLQDTNKIENFVNEPNEYIVKHGDILKITILTDDPESLNSLSQNYNNNINQSRDNLIFAGHLVDISGNIKLPQIGNLKISDLTVNEVKNLITTRLTDLQILINPTVDIKVLNWNFTILGEVAKPGKYYYNEPNFNLIQALGMAGDLTINGLRNDIKLIRMEDKKYNVSQIDLTSANFINNDKFQIVSGDIIIVDPNTTRVKSAGIIGNSGTLLSLLSFLLANAS